MAAREAVEAPRPQPPRVSLYSAALKDTATRGSGVSYRPRSCDAAGVADPCASNTYTIGDNESPVDFDYFEVWAGFKCSTFGFSVENYAEEARIALEAEQSHWIEREFWRGDFAQDAGNDNVYLAHPSSDRVSSGLGGESAVHALAILEDALASTLRGQRGMIHAPSSVVTMWNDGGALRRDGAYILTARDTIVVPGSGYDGSGPHGEPAVDGVVYAYGTGMVTVRLSDIEQTPEGSEIVTATNRTTNTVEARAFRYASVTFDPCAHLVVAVDAPVAAIGGAS